MAARYKAKIETSDGLRTCFEARRHREGKPDLVARFGGIPLRQDRRAVIRDPAPGPGPLPPQGADQTAPQAGMRALRDRHHGGSPPGHRPQGSSGSRDRASPRGPPSWRKCGARRSSSAPPATTTSTRTPSRTRHKSLESPVPGKRARWVRREAARKRPGSSTMNPGPRRAAHPTLRCSPPTSPRPGRPGRTSTCTCRTAGHGTWPAGGTPGSPMTWRSPPSRSWPWTSWTG